MNRRSFLVTWITLVSMVLLVSPGQAQQKQLNLLIWSEYLDPELVEAFEQAHDCKVNIALYEATEEMMAKLQAAGGTRQFDVIVASNESLKAMKQLKLIAAIDRSKVPNLAGVMPQFANASYDPEGSYGVPYQWGTVGLMWDSEKVQLEEAPSWKAVLVEPAGPFVLVDVMRDQLGVVLKYLGHSANSTDESAIREAGRVLLSAKQNSRCLGFDGSVGGKNKVLAGQAALAVVYNGEALRAQEEKESIAFAVPREGGLLWIDLMLLSSGAKNPELAHQFMNFILEPANNAKLSDFNLFATPVKASLDLIDPEARKNPAIYPDDETMGRMEFLSDVGPATRLYDQVWTAVKSR